jgi:predicted porin
MKRKIRITSIISAALICPCAAYAQSSVTLYGILDNAIQYVHNAGGHSTKIGLVSGTLSGSRWGLRGSEDLGGDLQAIFRLENGFNVDSGTASQGGRLFGRQAYVGLSSKTWGTVTLGRQYDALLDLVQPVQGDNYLEYFTSPGDVDDADNSVRFSNTVKWTSPDWSGFKSVVTYSLGGVAGSVGSGQSYSGALSYSIGSFMAAAGYLHIDNGNAELSARGTSSADSIFLSSVNRAYSSARSINITRAGAKYGIGQVTVGGYYSFSQYVPDGSSSFRTSERYHNGSIYALWYVTPSFLTEIGYNYLHSQGDSSATYHQGTIAAQYLFSKRTDIYGFVGINQASGKNGLGNAQAVFGAADIDAGKNRQLMALIGIRHKF